MVLLVATGDCADDDAIEVADAVVCVAMLLDAVVGDGEASANDFRCSSGDCCPFGTWRRSAWYFLHVGLLIFPGVIDTAGPDVLSYRSGSTSHPRNVYPSAHERDCRNEHDPPRRASVLSLLQH